MCCGKVVIFIVICHHLVNRINGNEISTSASTVAQGPESDTGSMSVASVNTQQKGSAVASFFSLIIDNLLPSSNAELRQQLTIYYDATDVTSQVFLNTTLFQTYALFRPFVKFYFVPCQNVQAFNGKLSCRSSQDYECFLNKLHSCAIAQATDEQALAQFIICTTQNLKSFPDFADCAYVCSFDYASMQACASSDIGMKLCKNHRANKKAGCLTIPRMTFSHRKSNHDDTINTLTNVDMVTDFKEIVCSRLKTKRVKVPEDCDSKIVANVYFESIMQESKNIIKTLSHIYSKFSPLFNLRFFPCALAQFKDGKLTCSESVDKDCVIGKMQSCAVHQLKDSSILLKFLSCSVHVNSEKLDFKKCADEAQIDLEKLKTCADSDLGTYLCEKNGKRNPVQQNQPAFVFNWLFSQKLNDQAVQDPSYIFCQQLRNYNMTFPDDCKGTLPLEIFYDAMDIDFRHWFINTMNLYFDQFSQFLVFEFIACRNAKETDNGVKCHGDEKKCQLDITQSCAIRMIPDETVLVRFFSCVMQDDDSESSSYETCAQLCQIDYKPIKECADSDKGKNMCKENMKRSPGSEQNFVFILNNKFDDAVSRQTFENYQRQVCQTLLHNKLSFPNECYGDLVEEENGPELD